MKSIENQKLFNEVIKTGEKLATVSIQRQHGYVFDMSLHNTDPTFTSYWLFFEKSKFYQQLESFFDSVLGEDGFNGRIAFRIFIGAFDPALTSFNKYELVRLINCELDHHSSYSDYEYTPEASKQKVVINPANSMHAAPFLQTPTSTSAAPQQPASSNYCYFL